MRWPRQLPVTFQEASIALGTLFVVNLAVPTAVWSGWAARPEDEVLLDGSGPLLAADPRLVGRIRRHLRPPSEGPLDLTDPGVADPSQHALPEFVLALSGNKTGGFFVECGAFDGETMSNTLLLERRYGWSGLLMEPARQLYAKMVPKRRHAWLLDACISDRPYAYTAQFQELRYLGTLKGDVTSRTWSDMASEPTSDFHGKRLSERREYGVPCYPLAAVLAALGTRSVDFFSLDVEGVEMGVLAGIPWRQLDVKIVAVEVFMGTSWNPQLPAIIDIMEKNGYIAEPLYIDWIFVKSDCEFAAGAVSKIRKLRRRLINSGRWASPKNVSDPADLYPYSKWDQDNPAQEFKMHLEA